MAAFPPIPTLLDSPVPLPGARVRASRLASLGCALLLVLAVAPQARADANTAPVPVSEGWRYRWGDSPMGAGGIPQWAQDPGATADWKEVEALKEPPGRSGNKFLWLSIPLPEGPWAEPALLVGEVTNAVEVYSNGKRVYTSGVLNPNGWEVSHNMTWHLIPVPPEALGSRLLLRLQSSNPNIGLFQYARIGSRAELLASVARDGQTPFVLAILLLSVAVGAGGAFLLHWRRRMLAGLAVFTASGGLIMQGLSGMPEALWNASIVGTRGTLLGVFLLVAGLIEFVSDAILNNERRWFRLGAMGFSAMSGLCAFISIVDLGTGQRLMVPFLPLTLSLMVVCLVIASIEAWRGNPDARLFIIGLSGLIFFTFMTVLPVIGVISTNFGNVTHWGYLALTLSLLGIVARRSIQVVRSLEAYTHKLEERQQEVRNLAERMGTGAGELATVVQQLRSTSDQQTEGVSRQAAALQEAEQTVKEIRRSSQMTAEKASSLAASAETAEQVGREGTAALERTLSDLAAIRTEVSEMARKILALDERTREVSGIVDSVKDLADQSNMLAINAAIEAARSGESGRGFGVVAREMRGLADQSIRATHRIREVLNGVSASMREAAQSSEKGDERVRLSLDAVRTSSAQFQQLAIIIGDSSASMRQITAAVSAQDAGTQQMAMAIQELSGQMQRTLKTVQETQEATRSVQALAESMSGIANQSLRTDEPLAPRS